MEDGIVKKMIVAGVLLGVAPAVAFGQQEECPEERCQIAPWFGGNGGFVGTSARLGGEDDVVFHLICDGRTISVEASPDSNGIVRQALNSSNGLNCPEGGQGRLEIDNLLPGGWYWVNDNLNSAVSALVPKSAAGNEQIEITDPGGVTLEKGVGEIGTFVRDPSGRVGIIPHLTPSAELPGCDGPAGGESAMDCRLGSALDWRLEANVDEVTRPLGTQLEKRVIVTLHGENFITTRTLSARAELTHHSSVAAVRLFQDGGVAPDAGDPGVFQWAAIVEADDSRCLPANNNPDRLVAQEITFSIAAMDGALPGLPEDGPEVTFTVNCPENATSAARGAELVPENPFPVDE